jgi:hypothetical protein
MKYTVFIFLVVTSVTLLSSNTIFMPEKSFGQVISDGLEESNLYLQISDVLANTDKKLDELVQTIKSGETEKSLEIVSNITMNIKEVRAGMNLIVDNPIFGGD